MGGVGGVDGVANTDMMGAVTVRPSTTRKLPADRVGIDYVVVGPPERAAHPGVEERWATVPALLPLVFHNQVLSVYAIRHHPS